MTAGGHRHRAARAVLRAGHAEPDRAGRDLSAARGAARPVPVQDLHHLSDARGGAADLPAHHRRRRARDHADARPATGSRPCSGWCGGCRSRTTASTTRWTWSARPAGPRTAGRPTSATGSPGAPGPRAGQSLILASKARAALAGRPSVSVDDIRAIAPPVLRHRIVHQLQRPGDRRDQRHDRQEAAERRPDPEGGRRCRRRGNIPILTPSRGSPT